MTAKRVSYLCILLLVLIGVFTGVCVADDPNQIQAAPLGAGETVLDFDPDDYNFLVYNPGGSDITGAMSELGITYDLRDSSNPVTAADLESHDEEEV